MIFGRKSKKFRQKREALKAQVRWDTEMALQAYLQNDPYMVAYWQEAAAQKQDEILRMYPRYQKPIKTRRTIIVPVEVPAKKRIEAAEW